VSEQHGERIPERLMDDLLRRDDHVLAGRLAQDWPDTSRALSLVERWRDRIAAGADDEVADRWLELMRNAEHARAEGNVPLYQALLAAAADWDDDVQTAR